MLFPSFSSRLRPAMFAGVSVVFLSLLTGCGAGVADGNGYGDGANSMAGIVHGGPNPIIGATVTLYVTNTHAAVVGPPAVAASTYGSAATAITTATTGSNGSFNFTLPASGTFCPAGEYAYIAGYGGNTGANSTTGTNTTTLLMAVVGACSSVYAVNSSTGVQTYAGNAVYMNELTTAVSAYALNNFMTVSGTGTVDIGAPVNNSSTASAATPSAAGLAHAFANVQNIIVGYTGYMQASYAGRGGAIPTDQIYAIGNILEACVNSNPTFTVTPSATANDGSACGQLFSLTTPPISGSATPVNTLQAMKNLAHYPLGNGTTWNGTGSGATATACTASTGGSLSAVQCLYNIAYPNSFYQTALTVAPPDWSMSIGYATGYGVETTGCASTCSGLKYPFALALDYQDNVYVLNYNQSGPTAINIVGIGYDGTSLFATANDSTSTDLTMTQIGTDTAGHVFGVTPNTSGTQSLIVWNTTDGSQLTKLTSSSLGSNSTFVLADPLNNINVISSQQNINMRHLTYTAPSTYSIASVSNTATGGTSVTGGPAAVSYGTNLDIYLLANPSAGPTVYGILNSGTYTKGTPAAGTYGSSAISSVLISGSSIANAFGIGGLSTGNAMAITSLGITPITRSGSTLSAGSNLTFTPVYGSTGYFRGTSVDGSNYVYAIDGANGTSLSGATTFVPSSTSFSTTGTFLGTYRSCFVKSSTTTCGTDVNGTSSGTPAILGPRGIGIDSAGDIWIASGVSANLTEIIGSAAPTWPGKSMGLQGLPQ